ncbi:MAG: hypothetical protein H7A46_08950 [Verrucomicrobiales bacterium]|nr:hypothetical protein [Verrucomicrobiales bacterium]
MIWNPIKNPAAAAALTALLLLLPGLRAADATNPAPLKPKPYPLNKCLISGEKLGDMGDPVRVVIEDHEFLLCCKGCEKELRADARAFLAKHDEAWKKVKPYPLPTCLVSDEKLGDMGKPVGFVYQGQEIRLCCKGCRKDFDKEPGKYLKKLPKKGS